jgi:DNA modification methylase
MLNSLTINQSRVNTLSDGEPEVTTGSRLLLSNCIDVLQTLPDESIDCIITDPPYGINYVSRSQNLPLTSVDLPDDQSGHICQEDDQPPYIEVNRNHPITRQRFTIAHEISHYLQHDTLLKAQGQLDRKATFASQQEAKLESEADEVAAQILMPQPLVAQYFKQKEWGDLVRFDTNMVAAIADEFRVSRAMVVTRLRELSFTVPFLSFA